MAKKHRTPRRDAVLLSLHEQRLRASPKTIDYYHRCGSEVWPLHALGLVEGDRKKGCFRITPKGIVEAERIAKRIAKEKRAKEKNDEAQG